MSDDEQRTTLPEPSSSIPAYLVDGIRRQDSEGLEQLIEYADDLIEWHKEQGRTLSVNSEQAKEASEITSFDSISGDVWNESVPIEDLETGEWVKVLNMNRSTFETGKIQSVVDNGVIVLTESGTIIQFGFDGYSDNYDAIDAKYTGDSSL